MIYRKVFDSQHELNEWYNHKYREMAGTWHTPPEDCNKHLDDLLSSREQRGYLLDVGCGGGHFIEQARKRGFSCMLGIDPSRVAIDFARSRLNAPTAAFGLVTRLVVGELEFLNKEIFRYDYIVSLGSLEHVVDLGAALDSIRKLLKYDGRWYFYLPNEKWTHNDQPNERIASAEEWKTFLKWFNLFTDGEREWGADTALWGHRT